MWTRLMLMGLGAFWLAMTALLWRSEYSGASRSGNPVDPHIVWKRVLTSPDSSSLAIVYRGERIGFCHLISSVGNSPGKRTQTDAPEGMIRDIGRYNLDLSGSMTELGTGARIRFDGELTLSPNQEWETFSFQIIARPMLVKIASTRSEGVLRFRIDSPELRTERLLRLSELSQPEAMLGELFGRAAPLALGSLPFAMPPVEGLAVGQQLQWRASTDRLLLGNSVSQVYRLELQATESVEVAVLVSRAGEILRVELPHNLILINEALTDL